MSGDRSDEEVLIGLILRAEPAGEWDKRVVILTRERGKISCFARGARRQGSKLMGTTDSFLFGRFRIRSTRSAYVLTDAEIEQSFDALRKDLDGAFLGMYFLEIAEYITRENNDEAQLLLLLYRSLQAILAPALDRQLIRAVYEIRTIAVEGELGDPSEDPAAACLMPDTRAALMHIITSPIGSLYSFAVSPEVREEIRGYAREKRQRYFHRSFSAEALLEE